MSQGPIPLGVLGVNYLDGLNPNANVLQIGDRLFNGRHSLTLEGSGHLVLKNHYTNQILWSSTSNSIVGPYYAIMQSDGDFCVRSTQTGNVVAWCAGTGGTPGRYLNLMDIQFLLQQKLDWGLVVQTSAGEMVWGNMIHHKTTLQVSPIRGSFLKASDTNNNKIENGKFVTNGRDYLTMAPNGQLIYSIGLPSMANSIQLWASINPGVTGNFEAQLRAGLGLCVIKKETGQVLNCIQGPVSGPNYYEYLYMFPQPFGEATIKDWGFALTDPIGQIKGGVFSKNQDLLLANTFVNKPILNNVKDLYLGNSYFGARLDALTGNIVISMWHDQLVVWNSSIASIPKPPGCSFTYQWTGSNLALFSGSATVQHTEYWNWNVGTGYNSIVCITGFPDIVFLDEYGFFKSSLGLMRYTSNFSGL
eukprot:gene3223-4035_t